MSTRGLIAPALVLSLAASMACRPAPEQPVPRSRSSVASSAEAERAVGPVARLEKATTSHMGSHFADVLAIHMALVRGSIGEAQSAAGDLLDDRPSAMLADWAPYLMTTHAAAEGVVRARTLDDACAHAAELARSCGECHAALGARLGMPPSEAPPAGPDDAALMRRHKWALDRLWEGLIVPSDEAWTRGASAFGELPPCADDVGGEQDTTAIAEARERARTFGEAARGARSVRERAEIYGKLLPTCASCHAAGC